MKINSNQTDINALRIFANICLALLVGYFAYIHINDFLATHRPSSLIIAAAETTAGCMFMLRFTARAVSEHFSDWVIAFVATVSGTFLRPAGTFAVHGALGLWQGEALMIIGACIECAGLLSLNTSYGIVPALRTIKTSGMYSFVRHPIYTSYFILAVGYFVSNPSLGNLLVSLLAVVLLTIRLRREERFLKTYPEYIEYQKQTPWKLIPFLY